MKLGIQILALWLSCALPLYAGPHWYTSKRFWAYAGIGTGSASADYASSEALFARGGIENDPIWGSRRPTYARYYSIGLPIELGIAYVDYRLSRTKRKELRFLSPAITTVDAADHIESAIANNKLK